MKATKEQIVLIMDLAKKRGVIAGMDAETMTVDQAEIAIDFMRRATDEEWKEAVEACKVKVH
jgi:hypothetical protein